MKESFCILVVIAARVIVNVAGAADDVPNSNSIAQPSEPADSGMALDSEFGGVQFQDPANAVPMPRFGTPVRYSVHFLRGPGKTHAHPDYLLSNPHDTNDMSTSLLHGNHPTRTLAIGADDSDADLSTVPAVQYGFQIRPGIYYDTGFVGSNVFTPATIATDGTATAHQRGFLGFLTNSSSSVGQNTLATASIPFRGLVGVQVPSMVNDGDLTQAVVDTVSTTAAQVQARSLYLRYLDANSENGLLFGQAETVFGDLGSVPTSIGTGTLPIGAVTLSNGSSGYTGVAQLRYSRFWALQSQGVIEAAVSAEDQSLLTSTSPDVTNLEPAGTSAVLTRYPTFVSRVRYGGANLFDSYQLAALVRPIGFNDPTFSDHFTTGWGVAANARFAVNDCPGPDALYLGAAGGQGIGGYIFNGTKAAVINTDNTINTLANVGAYASYHHVWSYTSQDKYWASNFMYGFVWGEPASDNDNHRLHQVGANLMYIMSSSASAGIEYQYGSRTIGSGLTGDDNRIMFVVNLTTGNSKSANTPAAAQAAAPSSAAAPARVGVDSAPATAPPVNRSRLRL